jgi:DNA replication and repair protein RecF
VLIETLERDIERGHTTIGPHRDDFTFILGGRDAARFGSSGQQRSIVLALKVGELQIFEEMRGDSPVLLIDDFDTELDSERIMKAVELAGSGIQMLVTTNKPELLGYIKNIEKIIKLKDGAVFED